MEQSGEKEGDYPRDDDSDEYVRRELEFRGNEDLLVEEDDRYFDQTDREEEKELEGKKDLDIQ